MPRRRRAFQRMQGGTGRFGVCGKNSVDSRLKTNGFNRTMEMMNMPARFEGGKEAEPRAAGRMEWKLVLRWVLRFALAVALIDGFFIEPFWIQVTHETIQGGVASPLKIAELSDIHTRGIGPRERKMFAILEAEKPDLIVVTGDTIGNKNGDYSNAIRVYEHLHAPLGVWVVRGNWENQFPARGGRSAYQEAGVHLLVNQNVLVRPDVALIGLDDPYSGTARPDAAMAGVPKGVYTIALFHSPKYLDVMAGRVDLALAGHTHGGQVRIPYVRPVWLPRGCGRYIAGWYEEGGTKMYVTRGLGTSILPVRFLCRPELTFLTINPQS